MVIANPHNQSTWESVPTTEATKAMQVNLQQENTLKGNLGTHTQVIGDIVP